MAQCRLTLGGTLELLQLVSALDGVQPLGLILGGGAVCGGWALKIATINETCPVCEGVGKRIAQLDVGRMFGGRDARLCPVRRCDPCDGKGVIIREVS